MAVSNPDLLWNAGQNLLAAAITALQDNGLRVPEHQIISWHAPAWDCCDHLGVYIDDIKPNSASESAQTRNVARVAGTVLEASVILTFIGCAAVGDPIPTDAAINANAQEMYRNAWTLYLELVCRFHAGELSVGDGCAIGRVGKLSPRPPMGGCEAFTITFTLQLA